MVKPEPTIRLDLNNPVFLEQLLTLQKAERHAALDTLNKIRQMAWTQLYRDAGIKWEKITSIKPPLLGSMPCTRCGSADHAEPQRTAMAISCDCSRSPRITTPLTEKMMLNASLVGR